MKKNLFCAAIPLFLILFASLNSSGETYLGTNSWGDPVLSVSADSRGMGGIATVTDKTAFAVLSNPALIGRFQRTRISASILPFIVNEERSRAIYDKFSQRVYNIYAANMNVSILNSGLGAVYPARNRLPLIGKIAFGAGIAPAYDFSYNYERVVRDKNYVITSSTKTTNTGGINRMAIGIAFSPVVWIKAGFSIDMYSGSGNFNTKTVYPATPASNYDSAVMKTLSGNSFSLGLLAEIDPHLTAGFNYRGSAKITSKEKTVTTGTASGEASREVVYPSVISAGVEYVPRNLIKTRLGADVSLTRWADDLAVDGVKNTNLRNTLEMHFGVEHFVKDFTPVRFGLSYAPWYGNRNLSTIMFTAGTGARYQKVTFDFGGGVGKREYFVGTDRTEPDLFEEFFTQIGMTIGYAF